MVIYAKKAYAKQAALNHFSEILSLSIEEVKFCADKLFTVKRKDTNAFYWESTKPNPNSKKCRSKIDNACNTVWQIADSMRESHKKEVVEACVRAGVVRSTAITQYYAWRKVAKESGVI